MNIGKNLEYAARIFPDRPAISDNDIEITYAEFDKRANRIATALIDMGIQPGDHVALCAPNSAEWMIFYFGAVKIGAIAITIAFMSQPDELAFYYRHSRFKVVFTTDDKVATLYNLGKEDNLVIIAPKGDMSFDDLQNKGTDTYEALERDRMDTAAVLYTGGTTGEPKGVMLTHENINVATLNVAYDEKNTEFDRTLCFLPFNHVFGQMHVMNTTVRTAGCMELLPSFDMEKVLSLMEQGRVTKFMAIPTVYVRMLGLDNLEKYTKDVRYCFSAAAAMALELVQQWKARTGLDVYEGYGMTEAAPTVTYNQRHKHLAGSVGTTVPSVEVQIRDMNGKILPQGEEGEICVRGRNVMKGYLNNPEATKAAFWDGDWFRSGDVGYLNPDGYLYIVDRIKDMIITGGENVYSREVEDVLYTVPEIEECAVIGLPDKEWGEKVTALITLRPEAEVDPVKLKDYMKQKMAPYKVPKEFKIIPELPKSPAGKILKRELRKQFTA